MPTYDLIVDQHVRYWLSVDAADPESAAEQIGTGEWNDSDNVVVRDSVRVYPEGKGRFSEPAMRRDHLLHTTDPDQADNGGLYEDDN